MSYINLLLRSCVLVPLLFIILTGGGPRAEDFPQGGSKPMELSFPKDAVQCVRGDYLIRLGENGAWKTFYVEDLFTMNRLVAIRRNNAVSLFGELTFTDSATPPDWNEIRLLVNEYEAEFPSAEKAVEAIESGRLGRAVEGVCRSINRFPKDKTRVYTKKKA